MADVDAPVDQANWYVLVPVADVPPVAVTLMAPLVPEKHFTGEIALTKLSTVGWSTVYDCVSVHN